MREDAKRRCVTSTTYASTFSRLGSMQRFYNVRLIRKALLADIKGILLKGATRTITEA